MQLSLRSALLCAATLAALSLAPRPAQALDFTFTFTTGGSSTGGAGQTVAGTLSGLADGNNPGPGITATVTQSPDPTLDGTYTFFHARNSGGPAFTVSGGDITFASASFLMANNILFFGSDPAGGTYFPQLVNNSNGNSYQNASTPDTFAPASVAAVPEPSTVAPFALAGLGLLGLMARARRQKKAA